MTTVVISQPMYFPWIGMLEQIRHADIYVHYDDVQFSKGSFTNRVQIKTAAGPRWLTVPLHSLHLGQHINQVAVEAVGAWSPRHLAMLEQAYGEAPFARDMLGLVAAAHGMPFANLGELGIASMESLLGYFGIGERTRFVRSSQLGIAGASDERVLAVVKQLGGDRYITGHGARKYLDHALFEANGVSVDYIDYRKTPYPQLHGAFTPFVSALDLLANCGRSGASSISSGTLPWRDFLATYTESERP